MYALEAQLIDVQLADNFEFGVDWSCTCAVDWPQALEFLACNWEAARPLCKRRYGLPGSCDLDSSETRGSLTGPALGVSYQGSNYGIVINALRSFGNLKVLSNLNVQVRNGTPALLSVGTSSRYVSQSAST